MATFRFDLVSPQETLFSNEVYQLDLPGRRATSACWPATPRPLRCSAPAPSL
jgi:hypothetical protein